MHASKNPRRILLGILGGGVLPGSSNPDPMSDQKMSFSTSIFWPDLFSDLAFRKKLSSLLTCRLRVQTKIFFKCILKLHISVYYYLLGIETINMFIDSCSSLENHIRFQTKIFKVCTCFRQKRHKNPTRWGGTYLYSLCKDVPPPPPSAG